MTELASPLWQARRARRRRRDAASGLTPLLDVLFLLLIFVLVSAHFDRRVVLPVDLPTATADDPAAERAIEIAIFPDGSLALGSDAITPDALARELADRPPEERLRAVIVQGDRSAELGHGVRVLDLLRRLGYRRVAFAVRGSEPSEE